MSPGIARCATCDRVLPIRVADELIAALHLIHGKQFTLLTVQCPKCRCITHIRRDDIERAA